MSFIDKYDSGTWRIESLLGEGAYGKVYKVSKEEYGYKSYAALKVIPVPHSSSEIGQLMSEGLSGDSLNSCISAMVEDITREIKFVQEFKGTANIVSCEDYEVVAKEDEPGCNILIRMELLESLETLQQTRSFGEDDAIAVGADICQALELLDKNGSVHRDVKPENIFFSKHGSYKLGDFGIARQIDRTSSGMSMRGTLNYMAPEVFKRLEYGTSVDLYSLGLVLYRILNNGRMPFVPAQVAPLTQSERDKLFERRMSGEPLPPPAFASPELSRVILKACAFDRENRFKTALEMRMALEACKPREIVLPPEPNPEPKPVPDPRPVPDPLPPYDDPNGTVPVSGDSGSKGGKSSVEITLNPARKVDEDAPSYGRSVRKPVKSQRMRLIGMVLAILTVFAIIVLRINGSSVDASANGTPLPTAKTANVPTPTAKPSATPAPTATPSPSLSQEEYQEKYQDEYQDEYIKIKGQPFYTTIDSIDLYGKRLTDADLSGLKFLTNLSMIYMPSNDIKDLKPFSGLSNLSILVLSCNEISDITPISNLTNLNHLDLSENNVTDISLVANFKNLYDFSIGANPVTDYSPISKLTKLIKLNLSGAQNITDLSFISNLTSLHTLYLGGTAISDTRFLSELTNMDLLWMNGNKIKDITHLSNLSKLTSLGLSGNQITDISPLSNLTNLDSLSLSDNQITDISPLSNLSNLLVLYLDDNQITDITPLSNLSSMEMLVLRNNQITDISPLSNLSNLHYLNLDGNQITDINLSNLSNLDSLVLRNNQITDISPLSNLSNLLYLYLDDNQITDISPLSNLNNLSSLDLADNQIEDVSYLANLTNLRNLNLSGNPTSMPQLITLKHALPNCKFEF
ncbi:MAG: leucine-rich repeat domain-containing protein [Clostridiales bacterium]|nr:leucine-rich repeat domain-containing protein [Clostridiales bacterium]